MVVTKKPNKAALIVYLDTIGLDAHRIQIDGADETGFNEIQVTRDGRPLHTSATGRCQLVTKRKEWPSAEVWKNVTVLLAGGGLVDIGYNPDGSLAKKVEKAKPVEVKGPKAE